MILLIKAFILGIVEGLTEFLPVSSTGHLIIVGDLLNFKGAYATMFEVVIQLGAILAIVYYYREKIWNSLKNLAPNKWGFRLWLKIVIAFIPSAILGLLLNDFIDKHLFSPFTVSIALVIGAIMMIIVENAFSNYKIDDMDKVTPKKSFWIGVAQCMSLFPGMSRSASTIMGGMMAGLSVKAAAEFSFFLAIPTMFGATVVSLHKGIATMTSIEWEALAVGFIMSFIVALIVVDKFLSYLKSHPLRPFAYYRLIVGIIMIGLVLTNIVK
ncbi:MULTISPECIES: undecaprenyl-diphosphate phosphatase [unclassified Thermoanaerobacterium]|uniref:undecaprenyl-diphosphate phosphatase n=1 Tax=Thermoanaerobacterium TaxID=28895 RepID=UPI000A16B1CA|nr:MULTISPECIES: undecaprenyl-diphosphate phosphatase [unclassified Thermoanaerobacterium]MDE4542024.1 undecaprenyl-diphosphate phosphatase [Thermoanaerobacterium sp. R66]ORX23995.1 undecaprenyl-diphosphatase [Thermoanaerobacterium sp. PSU-2]